MAVRDDFAPGEVLAAADLNDTFASKSDLSLTLNQRTAAYTLGLTDAGKQVEMNVASGHNLTIPLNSTAAFPTGTTILVVQTGAGQTTIAGASGVTVNGTPGLKLRTQWSAATLVKRGTDTWLAFGDLSA